MEGDFFSASAFSERERERESWNDSHLISGRIHQAHVVICPSGSGVNLRLPTVFYYFLTDDEQEGSCPPRGNAMHKELTPTNSHRGVNIEMKIEKKFINKLPNR